MSISSKVFYFKVWHPAAKVGKYGSTRPCTDVSDPSLLELLTEYHLPLGSVVFQVQQLAQKGEVCEAHF